MRRDEEQHENQDQICSNLARFPEQKPQSGNDLKESGKIIQKFRKRKIERDERQVKAGHDKMINTGRDKKKGKTDSE